MLFRVCFGIDFAPEAAGAGHLYHGLENRCQAAVLRHRRDHEVQRLAAIDPNLTSESCI